MSKQKESTCCPPPRRLARQIDARFFRALGDPCRLRILAYVAEAKKPVTVSAASTACPTDLSVVSRHLAMLRDVGILRSEKRGKEVYYAVQYDAFAETLRRLAKAIDRCCPNKRSTRKTVKKGKRT